ncbi:MAG TPA: response regulator [Steroidobacteraceae bacterium]|nr:response regulator [Steroidobacteraceae bacterium]
MSVATTDMPGKAPVRVLLVEDSAVLAARITELIRRLPDVTLVDSVSTEDDAVERITSATPDVVILDLHLRLGSGFGVLRTLPRNGGRRPKIIVLTGFDLPEYRRQAEVFGVEAFLNKSRDYHRLPGLLSSFAAHTPAEG